MVKLRAPGLLGCAFERRRAVDPWCFTKRVMNKFCDLVRQIFAGHGHASETLKVADRRTRVCSNRVSSLPYTARRRFPPQFNV